MSGDHPRCFVMVYSLGPGLSCQAMVYSVGPGLSCQAMVYSLGPGLSCQAMVYSVGPGLSCQAMVYSLGSGLSCQAMVHSLGPGLSWQAMVYSLGPGLSCQAMVYSLGPGLSCQIMVYSLGPCLSCQTKGLLTQREDGRALIDGADSDGAHDVQRVGPVRHGDGQRVLRRARLVVQSRRQFQRVAVHAELGRVAAADAIRQHGGRDVTVGAGESQHHVSGRRRLRHGLGEGVDVAGRRDVVNVRHRDGQGHRGRPGPALLHGLDHHGVLRRGLGVQHGPGGDPARAGVDVEAAGRVPGDNGVLRVAKDADGPVGVRGRHVHHGRPDGHVLGLADVKGAAEGRRPVVDVLHDDVDDDGGGEGGRAGVADDDGQRVRCGRLVVHST